MTSVMRAGVVSKSMLFLEFDFRYALIDLKFQALFSFELTTTDSPLGLVPLRGASPLCVSKRLLLGAQVIAEYERFGSSDAAGPPVALHTEAVRDRAEPAR